MRKNVYETNFERLVKLNICSTNGGLRSNGRSKSSGYMDLIFERLPHLDKYNGKTCNAFSLVHYFEQNGDRCQDPEMVLLVYPGLKMVEAFSYQQAIPPIYQDVYPEPGKVRPRAKKELNVFLRSWLNNLIAQKHGVQWLDSLVESA